MTAINGCEAPFKSKAVSQAITECADIQQEAVEAVMSPVYVELTARTRDLKKPSRMNCDYFFGKYLIPKLGKQRMDEFQLSSISS